MNCYSQTTYIYELKHLSMHASINDYSGFIYFTLLNKGCNSLIQLLVPCTSFMVLHYLLRKFWKNISSPSVISKPLPSIISHLSSEDSSTLNVSGTVFVVLNYGRQKYKFISSVMIEFPAWILHVDGFVFKF